jgi:hypothetical protein
MLLLRPTFTVLTVIISGLFSSQAPAQNMPPVITNVSCLADTVSKKVIVYYDLADNEGDDVEVIFRISADSGKTFIVNTDDVNLDVGYPVTPGAGKILVWNYTYTGDITQFEVKLVADDRVPIDIQEIVDQVDSVRIMSDLQYIAQERNYASSPAHWLGLRDSLNTRFDAYDLWTKRDSFDFQGVYGQNEIGRQKGCKNQEVVYVLDAHYDGVSASPGADDNGAGVAGVLEGARILSQYNFERSINFIGFDLEELGTVGSARYVNDGGMEEWEDIRGVINYEMIGFYSELDSSQVFPNGFVTLFPEAYDSVAAHNFKGDFLTNIGNQDSQPLINTFDSCAAAYVPSLRVISIAAPGLGFLTPDLRRSDHSRFWDAGIQALMLSDGAEFRNSNYHTPADSIGSLNLNFMTNNIKASIATIATLARPMHCTHSFHGITVHPESSVGEFAASPFSFQLNPNPTSGETQVVLNGLFPNEVQLKIYDLEGKKMLDQKYIPNYGTFAIQAPKSWANGLYIVVVSGAKSAVVQRMMLNR